MVDNEPGNIIPVKQSKSNRPVLFIVLGVVAILLGVKVFLDYREKQELQAFYQTEMAAAMLKLDNINEELLLKINEIDLPKEWIRDYRLTLDYPEDLKLIKKIEEHFNESKEEYNINNLFGFLDSNPEIVALNKDKLLVLVIKIGHRKNVYN